MNIEDSPEQMCTEVVVAHRLGYWWPNADDISTEEIAEADAYLERYMAYVRGQAVAAFADRLTRMGVHTFNIQDIRKYAAENGETP